MRKPDVVNKENYTIHPQRFNLWLFIVCIVMLFAAFTSAYIVRKSEGNWLLFELPSMFSFATTLIVLSSVSMFWAYFAARKDEIAQVKTALITTLILGAGFCISQFLGWKELVEAGLVFSNRIPEEISVSFVYVLVGVHALHVMAGLIWLGILIARTFKLEVHKKNMLGISLCNTYWHFIGLLWIYLFLFLYFTR